MFIRGVERPVFDFEVDGERIPGVREPALGRKVGLASWTRWTGDAVEGEERKAVIEVS